jgi:hypothetical protein
MIVIHAGFPKCASSFLQTEVFPALGEYRQFRPTNWAQDWSPAQPEWTTEQNLIVSAEGFTSFRGLNDTGDYQFPHQCALFNVRRFLGPNLKVLFVIRRQDDLVESYYRFKRDFATPDDMFIDHPTHWRFGFFWGSRSRRAEYLRHLDFAATILPYEAVFGRSSIYIFFYEDINRNRTEFIAGLERVFERDLRFLHDRFDKVVNPSRPEGYRYPLWVRIVNRASFNTLASLLPNRSKFLTDEARAGILAKFKKSNRFLFDYFGLEDRYGYCR